MEGNNVKTYILYRTQTDYRYIQALNLHNTAKQQHIWVQNLPNFRNILRNDKQDGNKYAHENRPHDRAGTVMRLINHVLSTTVPTKNDFIQWIQDIEAKK